MILFKSDFANFKECTKRVWLTKFSPYASTAAFDPYLAECGHIVGNRAKKWAKQFIPTELNNSIFEFVRNSGRNSVEHTLEHLGQGTPLLYESSFIHNEVYCRTDLLWNLNGTQIVGEVKSSTSIKNKDDAVKKYGLDLAVQYYGMSSAISDEKIKLNGFQLIVPDGENSKPGIEGLTFKRIEMLDEVQSMQEEVHKMAEEIQAFLSEPYEPSTNKGSYCKGCVFDQQCRNGKFDLLAYELPGFNSNWRKIPKLQKSEYPLEMQTPVKDIPDELLTLPLFKRVQASEKSLVHQYDIDNAKEHLSKYDGPFGYIDFEFASSFPYIPKHGILIGSRIPFQYVLYRRESAESPLSSPSHYLNLEDADPRRSFAESLIKDCKGLKTIFIYSKGAEGGVIKDLITLYPDLAEELSKILDKFCDLLDVVRENYYHPDMLGSFSLKSVLPTINVTYDNLAIKGGNQAQLQYLFARYSPDRLDYSIEETKKHLEDYCGLDTLGMVYLHDFLISGEGAKVPMPIELRGVRKMNYDEQVKNEKSIEPANDNQLISKQKIFGLVGVIIIVWLLWSPIIYHFFGIPQNSAELGDSFGVVNSLFSALGLAGIVLSIVIQQQDLRLTRNEVKESAQAQKQSAMALEKQAKLHILTSKIQALSIIIESINQQITQNDRWNDKVGSNKFDNKIQFQKRNQYMTELWKLKEKLELFENL